MYIEISHRRQELTKSEFGSHITNTNVHLQSNPPFHLAHI